MRGPSSIPSRHRRRAFSLFELLLVVVVMMALLGAFVIHLDSMRHGAELREGVIRLQTLLRFARAEATLRGKRVRVELHPSSTAPTERPAQPVEEPVRVMWEPDPLNDPGRFRALDAVIWADQPLAELIVIEEVVWPARTSTDPEPARPPEDFTWVGGGPGEPGTQALIFDPEGASESVEILVRSRDPADARSLLVELDGLTGEVTHRELSASDLETRLAQDRAGSGSAASRGWDASSRDMSPPAATR